MTEVEILKPVKFLDANHNHEVLETLRNGSTDDVTIKLRDGEVRVNKDVLMASCPYFATMFSIRNQGFVESQTNCVKMMTVEKSVMNIVVRYLLTNNLNHLNHLDLKCCVKVMEMMRFLLLDEAASQVAAVLESSIDNLANILTNYSESVTRVFASNKRGSFEILSLLPVLHETMFEGLYNKFLEVVCNFLGDFMKNKFEREFFISYSFEIVKDIIHHPLGSTPEKIKAFESWFSANEDMFDDEEKEEILKFHLNNIREAEVSRLLSELEMEINQFHAQRTNSKDENIRKRITELTAKVDELQTTFNKVLVDKHKKRLASLRRKFIQIDLMEFWNLKLGRCK